MDLIVNLRLITHLTHIIMETKKVEKKELLIRVGNNEVLLAESLGILAKKYPGKQIWFAFGDGLEDSADLVSKGLAHFGACDSAQKNDYHLYVKESSDALDGRITVAARVTKIIDVADFAGYSEFDF